MIEKIFVAPQTILTFLQPLQLAKVSAIVALGAYIYQQLSCNKAILPRGTELPLLGLFLVMAVLSIPFSLWPGGSLGLLTDFYSKSLIVGLLIAQTLTSMSRFKQLLRYLMVFLVIDCFIALRGFDTGEVVEGSARPSSDTPTHLHLYQQFENVGGIVHTHSTCGTSFAQAGREIPCLGTTHADNFYGEIPVTRPMTQSEVEVDYELNSANVIVEHFREKNLNPDQIPGVLLGSHAPFA